VNNDVQRDHGWPDEFPMTGAAFARMDTKISCILTRFRLKSCLSLIPFYLSFRRVLRSTQGLEGFLQALFLVENLHTCYTLSLWADDSAIVKFGTNRAHVEAANSAFRATYNQNRKRMEIWSGQFRLWGISCHNSNWEGFDLQSLLADQWSRREQVAHMGEALEEKHVG
jgi:hypothetical protein